ncbi:MAG: tRNA (guanosine(37)-N1)-methyltransferase TrmD [Patescibacteria group bacterium]
MPKQKKRQFDVITIFPGMISSYANESILGRSQKKGLIKVVAHDLRKWTSDKHKSVDDTPYGGGPGMVMKVEPFDLAVRDVGTPFMASADKKKKIRVIVMSASGKQFTQKDAKRLAKYDQLIFLCGRYEGIDARVEEHIADEALSIGEYVLTGGELPALIMIDAVARNVPGVLGAKESLADESHNKPGQLEYPQYTKPEIYVPPLTKGGLGGVSKTWKVPPVLLSGDHKKIEDWRKDNRK